MTHPFRLPILGATLLVGAALSAAAQPAVPAPAASAAPAPAAASRAKPGKHLPTPTEKRESATAPGDIRPERPVLPQVRIPIGKAPPAALPASGAERRARTAPAGAIDDSAARCGAEKTPALRQACRERLGRPDGQR